VRDIHALWAMHAVSPDGKTLSFMMALEALRCPPFGCQTYMHGGITVGLQ